MTKTVYFEVEDEAFDEIWELIRRQRGTGNLCYLEGSWIIMFESTPPKMRIKPRITKQTKTTIGVGS